MHPWINPETQNQPEGVMEFVGHSPVLIVLLSFLGVAALLLIVVIGAL